VVLDNDRLGRRRWLNYWLRLLGLRWLFLRLFFFDKELG